MLSSRIKAKSHDIFVGAGEIRPTAGSSINLLLAVAHGDYARQWMQAPTRTGGGGL